VYFPHFFIGNRNSLKSKSTPKYTGSIQEKHLIKTKKKKSKKVMKTIIMRTIIGSHPKEKGIKKEGL